MTTAKDIALAVLPALVPVVATQVGEGVREAIRAKREAVCSHGKPGGRLCARCSEVGK